MKQRVHLITLGVDDVEKSAAFYDALGWERTDTMPDTLIAYDLYGATLGLYNRAKLQDDLGIELPIGSGSMTLSCNVRTKEEVKQMLDLAVKCGAKAIKEPYDIFWGGHIAYFSDPNGHVWEIAHNPFSELGPNDEFCWNGF